MSIKNKFDTKDGLEIKLRTLESSEKLFNYYFLKSFNLFSDRVKNKVTNKQMARLKMVVNEANFINRNPVYIHNTANTTAKPVGQISSSLPLSPKTQNQIASRTAQEIPLLVGSILKLCEKMGYNTPFSAFATFTRPNVDGGQLTPASDRFNRVLMLLLNDLRNGNNNKGGLKLPALDGSNATFIGDLTAIENVANKKALKKKSFKNLFHLHAHDVMTFDKELDFENEVVITQSEIPNMTQKACKMPKASAVLFKWWAKHNRNLTLSPDAFQFFATYDKNAKNGEISTINEQFAQTFKEATKYSIKPDFWKNLPSEPDVYSKKVFAEIINCFYGRTLHRPHGVVASAKGFVNFISRSKLSGAVMNAYYRNQLVSDYVPDIYTKISNFSVKNNHSSFNSTRQMSADQAVYFNSRIVANAGFDADLLNHVTFPRFDSKRKNARVANFKYLLSELCFAKKGRDGLLNRVQSWRDSLAERIIEAKSGKAKQSNFINYLEAKLEDVNFLSSSLASKVNAKGQVLSRINWAKRALYLNIFDAMQALETSCTWNDVLNNRRYKNKPANIETRLINIFGSDVCDNATVSTFVSENVVKAYLAVSQLSRDELLNIIWGGKPESDVALLLYSTLDFSNSSLVGNYAESLIFDGVLPDAFGLLKNYSDSEIDSVAKLQKLINRI